MGRKSPRAKLGIFFGKRKVPKVSKAGVSGGPFILSLFKKTRRPDMLLVGIYSELSLGLEQEHPSTSLRTSFKTTALLIGDYPVVCLCRKLIANPPKPINSMMTD